MSSETLDTIIIICAVIIVGGLGYFLYRFFKND